MSSTRLVRDCAYAVLLVAASACLRPGSVTCPSGQTCPENTTCVELATGSLCATEDQLHACDGKPELATCDDNDLRKVCSSGVCLDLCGNGVVELSESCDDGNRRAGDGCSDVCLAETCGNGVVDVARGEECDDGVAFVSRDGCSSGCQLERPVWRQLPSGLARRAYVALAYDAGRDEVVAFGGFGEDGFLDDTWIWSRTTLRWRAAVSAVSPPQRSHHSMVYDPNRQRVIMFGGYSTGGVLGDMWEWDGTQWAKLAPTTLPPPRRDAQLAYDAAHDQIVMFGGSDVVSLATTGNAAGAVGRTDTWLWDGATWTQATPATSPPAGETVQLAFDVIRGYTVACIAGVNEAPDSSATWTWDGTTWTDRATECANSVSTAVRLIYEGNASSGRVLLRHATGETYEWTGSAWSPLVATQAIWTRYGPGVAYDGANAILLGGSSSSALSDRQYSYFTYRFQGTNWIIEAAAASPPLASAEDTVAYDVERGHALMVGGSNMVGQTWQWSAGGWHRLFPQDTTPYVGISGIAGPLTYDRGRDRYVLFSAPNAGTPRVFEFDGIGWLETTSPGPTRHIKSAMAYDAARGVSVLFGGDKSCAGCQNPTNETWTWNGSGWTLHTPAILPPARKYPALAYDPIRERVVLFGGEASPDSTLGDTWEWDGASWTEIMPADGVSPTARSRSQLVYNPLRRTLLLHAGRTLSTGAVYSDVWEWDGARWTLMHADDHPIRFSAAAFFDSLRGGMVVYGGRNLSSIGTNTNETWFFSFESLEPTELCRTHDADLDGDGMAGCADPDCWGRCMPACPPRSSCATNAPRCGDGTCNTLLEDHALCPADCP